MRHRASQKKLWDYLRLKLTHLLADGSSEAPADKDASFKLQEMDELDNILSPISEDSTLVVVSRFTKASQIHGYNPAIRSLETVDDLSPPSQTTEIAMDEHERLFFITLLIFNSVMELLAIFQFQKSSFHPKIIVLDDIKNLF